MNSSAPSLGRLTDASRTVGAIDSIYTRAPMTTRDAALKKLGRFMQRIASRPHSDAIDIECHLPVEDAGVHVVAYSKWLIHAEEPVRLAAEFVDDTAWGGGDIALPELRELLAQALPRTREKIAPIYIRNHDSAWSLALQTGDTIWDSDRPDRVPPPRMPVRKVAGWVPGEDVDGETVRRGDGINLLQASTSVPTEELCERLLQQGIRVALEDDGNTISHIAYTRPFARKVCGIWIGASAWQVEQILGAPVEEFTLTGRRAWKYKMNGPLSVAFDENDLVALIGR